MTERKGLITVNGGPLTLLGNELKVGDRAPNAILASNDLKPVELNSYRGKVVVISAVPSLDTPTCDIETRTFNKKATSLGKDVVILTISMDLPFAQKRWCGASGVNNVVTLSDYKDASFGSAYGVLIKELHLLTRSIFVLDREGTIRYTQLVKEISKEPDYDAVYKAVEALK
jgi:thiol peroxidase